MLTDYAILDGPELAEPVLLAGGPGTRSASSPCMTWRAGSEPVMCRCLGWVRSSGIVERPEGGHEAWFSYADHTTPPPPCTDTTREPAKRRCGAAPRCRRVPAVRAGR